VYSLTGPSVTFIVSKIPIATLWKTDFGSMEVTKENLLKGNEKFIVSGIIKMHWLLQLATHVQPSNQRVIR
jgi:hypothetical protein